VKTGLCYQAYHGLVLGFHGTDKKTAERVLAVKAELAPSTNEYDWLGHGVYFWEYSPARAWEFAHEKKRRGEIETPAVIGAVIAPGVCLNLLESSALAELKLAYDMIELDAKANGGRLPENVGGEDLFKRYLDCAVVEMACRMRELSGAGPLSQVAGIKPNRFESCRACQPQASVVDVAQLVESWIVIPVVAGSSPVVHPMLTFARAPALSRASPGE
jgi:hypothetical protein